MKFPPLLKNLITVSSGVVTGQVLGLLAAPILSRHYSAGSFGILGTFLTIASILGAFSTMQYGAALALPKRDAEAINILSLGFVSVITVSTLTCILSIAFPTHCLSILKAPDSPSLLFLLPSFVLLNGLNLLLVGWGCRRKQYRHNAASVVARSVSLNTFQLASAPLSPTGAMLASGTVIGELCSCINLLSALWRHDRKLIKRCASVFWIKKLCKQYIDFPAYSMPQNLLNAISQGLPVLLLGHFFSIEIAGFYAFSIRLIQSPMSFLLTPLRQVLFQRFCEVQNGGSSPLPLYRKCTFSLFAVIIAPTLVCMFILPDFFAFAFGDQWRQAGEYGRWLFLWQAVGFCNVPSVLMARVLRMQRQLLCIDAAGLVLRSSVLIVSGLFLNDVLAVAAFAVIGTLINICLIVFVWKKTERRFSFCVELDAKELPA